jgi:hypothetical protein
VVSVRSPSGVTPGNAGCQTVTGADPPTVSCQAAFDAVVVEGKGGNDTITMDLIDENGVLAPVHGEAYGDAATTGSRRRGSPAASRSRRPIWRTGPATTR